MRRFPVADLHHGGTTQDGPHTVKKEAQDAYNLARSAALATSDDAGAGARGGGLDRRRRGRSVTPTGRADSRPESSVVAHAVRAAARTGAVSGMGTPYPRSMGLRQDFRHHR